MQRSFTIPQSVYDLARRKNECLIVVLYTELDHNANHTKDIYKLNCGYELERGQTHITRRQLEDFIGVSGKKITNMINALIENGDLLEIRKGKKVGRNSLPSIYYLTRYNHLEDKPTKRVKPPKKVEIPKRFIEDEETKDLDDEEYFESMF